MENTEALQFTTHLEKIRARTLRVARCIPPEKIEWTFKPGRFTLGDLLRHLAGTERYMWAENASFQPSRYPGHDRSLADGFDNVFAYVDRLHKEVGRQHAGVEGDLPAGEKGRDAQQRDQHEGQRQGKPESRENPHRPIAGEAP